jgi:hypothetical protein
MEISPRKGAEKSINSLSGPGLDVGASRGDLRQGGDGNEMEAFVSGGEGSGGAALAAVQARAEIGRRVSGRKRKMGSEGRHSGSRSKPEPSSRTRESLPRKKKLPKGYWEEQPKNWSSSSDDTEEEEDGVSMNKKMEEGEEEEELMAAVAMKEVDAGEGEEEEEIVTVNEKVGVEDEQDQGPASVEIRQKLAEEVDVEGQNQKLAVNEEVSVEEEQLASLETQKKKNMASRDMVLKK